MYALLNNKEKSFIITYDSKNMVKDKRNVKTYRFTVEAGNITKFDFLYFNHLFKDISIFNKDIEKICDILNNKTNIYSGNKVSISLFVTANHTFKFEIVDIFDIESNPTKRVAISLSNEEYNQLINIHAGTNNKTISHTMKEIYLKGLLKDINLSFKDLDKIIADNLAEIPSKKRPKQVNFRKSGIVDLKETQNQVNHNQTISNPIKEIPASESFQDNNLSYKDLSSLNNEELFNMLKKSQNSRESSGGKSVDENFSQNVKKFLKKTNSKNSSKEIQDDLSEHIS